jgi:2-C-methyl-D-erythritol 4-phosphate cytidylyltransferase/2-C-methyl-D-erythritol 2,4-cyclodiphosphate synthase
VHAALLGIMDKKTKLGVIICAAGRSTRMAGVDKLALKLGGKTVLERTVDAFIEYNTEYDKTGQIGQIVIAASPDNIGEVTAQYGEKAQKCRIKITVCQGGETRQKSVAAALKKLGADIDFVAVHDGARPFVSKELIENTYAAAQKYGAAVPGLFATETIHIAKDGGVFSTLDRSCAFTAQTPQIFKRELLEEAYAAAGRDGFCATDDCALVMRVLPEGAKCAVVQGDESNIKITTLRDIAAAERILGIAGGNYMKIGYGYDVHRLVPGRRLLIGGVDIPYERGLLGHSDADVLIHAIIDALLGAAGERDIGYHFPDSSPEFKDISSIVLLEKTADLLNAKGFSVGNIDATVVCQAPRLSGYIEAMGENISRTLGIARENVNIKAKTEEGLGFTGAGEGICAHAVCILQRMLEK